MYQCKSRQHRIDRHILLIAFILVYTDNKSNKSKAERHILLIAFIPYRQQVKLSSCCMITVIIDHQNDCVSLCARFSDAASLMPS